MFPVIAILVSSALAQDCAESVSVESLSAKVDEAMLAFASMDEEGFLSTAAIARGDVSCLKTVFPSTKAAALHRMNGLEAFVNGDTQAAEDAFAAALALEPEYLLSAKLAPKGGKLDQLYQAAKVRSRAPTPFKLPTGYTTWVDGIAAPARDEAFPAVVQVGKSSSSLNYSAWLAAHDPFMPDDLGLATAEPFADLDAGAGYKPAKPPKAVPAEKPEKLEKTPSVGGGTSPLLIAGGVSAGVAAGLYGTSLALRSSFDKEATQGKFAATNGTFFGAIGVGALAVGLMVGGSL